MPSQAPFPNLESACKVLGLSPDADAEMIRRAYRRLAFDCHPDRHAGNPEMEQRFKRLSEAYRVAISAWEGAVSVDAAPLPPPVYGEDVSVEVLLDFLQVARGDVISVSCRRAVPCPKCRGGQGDDGCGTCRGKGRVKAEDIVRVHLPAGLEGGETFRVPGEGGAGLHGGLPGDLFLIVSSRRHPAFRRAGLDVHSTVKVPAFRLAEGGAVRVFTVHGATQVSIPAKTRGGRTIRLRGWGIHRQGPEGLRRGDHYVTVVQMPAKPEEWAGAAYAHYRRRMRDRGV
ncbi:MAG: DnaJ domain-containing protein [bacterium]|nr:DnaJ domain-containing protein [bacterium]